MICPYANLLGTVVEARKYVAYEFEPCVVVAVSWHGSLGLRKLSDIYKQGFWLPHEKVDDEHVRFSYEPFEDLYKEVTTDDERAADGSEAAHV